LEECKNIWIVLKNGSIISNFSAIYTDHYIKMTANEKGYGFDCLAGPYSSNEQQKTLSA